MVRLKEPARVKERVRRKGHVRVKKQVRLKELVRVRGQVRVQEWSEFKNPHQQKTLPRQNSVKIPQNCDMGD